MMSRRRAPYIGNKERPEVSLPYSLPTDPTAVRGRSCRTSPYSVPHTSNPPPRQQRLLWSRTTPRSRRSSIARTRRARHDVVKRRRSLCRADRANTAPPREGVGCSRIEVGLTRRRSLIGMRTAGWDVREQASDSCAGRDGVPLRRDQNAPLRARRGFRRVGHARVAVRSPASHPPSRRLDSAVQRRDGPRTQRRSAGRSRGAARPRAPLVKYTFRGNACGPIAARSGKSEAATTCSPPDCDAPRAAARAVKQRF